MTNDDLALQALADETIRLLRTDADPHSPEVKDTVLGAATRLAAQGDPKRASQVLIAYEAAAWWARQVTT